MSLGHASHGRPGSGRHKGFSFSTGDLVLVKWDDGMVYFAKIKRVDQKRGKCTVVFDDKSQDEAEFTQIHSVDETTTDIICIKCKKDNSDSPNEIVLCDMCGIGFHQKCHNPPIPASALQLDIPWNCSYCQRGVKCPFLTESLDVLQNLLSDNEASTGEEDEDGVESEYDQAGMDESSSKHGGNLRKRMGKKSHDSTVARKERRKSLRLNIPASELPSLATTDRRSSRSMTQSGSETKPTSSDSTTSEVKAQSPFSNTTAKSEVPPESPSHRKRKKYHITSHQKKMKRSSVESRTVSVTRIDTPIYEDNLFSSLSPVKSLLSPVVSPTQPESCITLSHDTQEELNSAEEASIFVSPTGDSNPMKTKQRRFRVSLSLPEDIEKKSPKKSSSISLTSPISSSSPIPSWDAIVSPKRSERAPSSEKESCCVSPKSAQLESAQLETKKPKLEQEHVPFSASPLPTTSKKQLDINLAVKVTPPSTLSMDTGINEKSSESEATLISLETKAISQPESDAVDMDSAREPTLSKSSPNYLIVDAAVSTNPSQSVSATNHSLNSEVDTGALSKSSTDSITEDVGVTMSSSSATSIENKMDTDDSGPSTDSPTKLSTSSPAPISVSSTTATSAATIAAAFTESSEYLLCSKMDVGVTGKPAESKLAATNPVLIGSSKVPHSQHTAVTTTAATDSVVAQSSKITDQAKNPVSPADSDPPLGAARTTQYKRRMNSDIARPVIIQSPSKVVSDKQKELANAAAAAKAAVIAAAATAPAGGHSPTKCPAMKTNKPTNRMKQEITRSAVKSHREVQGTRTATSKVKHISKDNPPPASMQIMGGKEATLSNTAPAPTPVITTLSPQVREHEDSAHSHHHKLGKTDRQLATDRQARKKQPPPVSTAQQQQKSVGERKESVAEKRIVVHKTQGKPVSEAVKGRDSDADVIITGVEPCSGGAKEIHKVTSTSMEPIQSPKTSSQSALQVSQFLPVVVNPTTSPYGSDNPSCGTIVQPLYYHVQAVTSSALSEKLTHVNPPCGVQQLPSDHPAYTSTAPATSPLYATYSTDSVPRSLTVTSVPKHIQTPPVTRFCAGPGPSSIPKAVIHHSTGAPVYYNPVYTESGPHPSTTKPYAIVNAIPAQPPDVGYRHIALPQKPGVGIVGGMADVGSNSNKQHTFQLSSTASTQFIPGSVVTSVPTGHGSMGAGTILTPPPTYSTYIAEKASKKVADVDLDLQSIQKKIGDAFSQSSEVMLVSAFEDAWKKFQANEKVYSETKKEKAKELQQASVPKPEDSGVAAQGNLVHQMSTKSRVMALTSSEKVGSVPLGKLPQQQQPQQPQQLVIQPAATSEYATVYAIPTQGPAGKHNVHVAGLYYPAVETIDPPNQSDLTKVAKQVRVSKALSSQHKHIQDLASGKIAKSHIPTSTASQPGPPQTSAAQQKFKSYKQCARCGKNATYLCSGCHLEWYCGRDCQLESWEKHSDYCKA